MKSELNQEQIAITIQKIFCYKQLENLNFEAINNCFEGIKDNYKTRNASNLELLNRQVLNNFKRINEYNDTNILIFDKNLEKYQKNARDAAESFGRLR